VRNRRYPRQHKRPIRITATLRDPRRGAATTRVLGR
jgi:hypothetical protein